MVVAMLEQAAIRTGARRAAAGEFSQRAFLNDKLDLAQAEAVADLIASGTEQAARAALRSLSGEFSAAVGSLSDQLIDLRSYVEAAIDFPDDDIDFLADEELSERLALAMRSYDELLNAARSGRVLRDGYRVVLVGVPNVGKSSLMNALAGDDAAIVTEVAGTTRDVLREQVDLDGLAVEIVDTAGLREDPDRIEEEGIRRARAAMSSADLVLVVTSADCPAVAGFDLPPDVATIEVRNKVDLDHEKGPGDGTGEESVIRVSARTGAGLDGLRAAIREQAGVGDVGEGAFTARQRHLDALDRSRRHFEVGRAALAEHGGELLAEELRLALDALIEITGRVRGEFRADDLLGRIFSEFCIGK